MLNASKAFVSNYSKDKLSNTVSVSVIQIYKFDRAHSRFTVLKQYRIRHPQVKITPVLFLKNACSFSVSIGKIKHHEQDNL